MMEISIGKEFVLYGEKHEVVGALPDGTVLARSSSNPLAKISPEEMQKATWEK